MSDKKPIILIVDDNQLNLQIIAGVVERDGYEAVLALNGNQVFEYIKKELPDLILLDIMMPEMDGYEICRHLKANEKTSDLPIIFLTAKAETEDVVKGFEEGAADYVIKPFDAVELSARIKNHLDLKRYRDELKTYNSQLIKTNKDLFEANRTILIKNKELKEALDKLEYLAKKDPLTDLYNRRYMMEKIEEEIVRYNRSKKGFSLIISDIDFFKNINDTYGHGCGDFVLKILSERMLEAIREQDFLGRWGGEEFLIFLPETDVEGAKVLADRIRIMIEESILNYKDKEIRITMTFGITAHNASERIDDTLIRADNALYKGKQNGRNQVVVV